MIERFDPLKGERLRVLDDDGRAAPGLDPGLADAVLRALYERMVRTRAADAKALKLQRQGRLGTYAPSLGHEAAQVGLASAMTAEDWFFPYFRDLGAYLTLGYPLADYFHFWMGHEAGLRTPDGLNIFPIAIPVGSQIPQAVGAGIAVKYRKLGAAVVTTFGDGATSEGDFHEGLNFAGVFRTPNVFVCFNNQYAISVPRSGQTAAATIAQKAVAYGFPGVQVDGNDVLAVYAAAREALAAGPERRRTDPHRGLHLPAGRPHDLGRRRPLPDEGGGPGVGPEGPAGPLQAPSGPQGALGRGRGEGDPGRGHGGCREGRGGGRGPAARLGRRHLRLYLRRDAARPRAAAGRAQGLAPGGTAMIMTMVQAINQALAGEMARDDRIVVLGEDVGRDGGVFRATDGLFDRFGPERVMDTPLAESAAVGAAIGMAALGLRPVVEIQFMGFIYPAFNQIVSHVARLRNRTRGRFTAPMVIRTPYGAGVGALEHHSESTEALFCQIPGLTVVVPSNASDAKGLLIAALRGDDPVLFLEPTRLYRAEKQEVPEEPYEVPLRRAAVVREGRDLTVVAWGAMVPVAREAAAAAEAEGVSAEIVDLRTLSPMDRETVLASVRKTGRALVLHEAPKTGGLGAEIAATIGERALLSLSAPVLRVTAPDITVPLPKSEDLYYPNAERVLRAVRKLMEY